MNETTPTPPSTFPSEASPQVVPQTTSPTSTAVPATSPSTTHTKLIAGLLVIIVFLVGGMGYLLMTNNSSATLPAPAPETMAEPEVVPTSQVVRPPSYVVGDDLPISTQEANINNAITITTPVAIFDGDSTDKETLCYTYAYPTGFSTTEDNACFQMIRDNDPNSVFSIRIEPINEASITKDQSTLQALVDNRLTPYTIISSQPMTIGGVDAIQIVEKDEASPAGIHLVRTFVRIPGRYDTMGRETVGFEIQTIYSDDDSTAMVQTKKEVLGALLASMQWK